MLNTHEDEWPKFIERDLTGKFLDIQGNPTTYQKLLEEAGEQAAERIAPDRLIAAHRQSQDCIQRLMQTISDAELDSLIVIGDDQDELYHTDNLPSLLIYYGETIRNVPRHIQKPNKLAWFQRARAGYYEASGYRDYPVHAGLARHMIASLVDAEFDVSTAASIADEEGEGHAFAFVHKRLMTDDKITPIIPVCLNTYYPPNQPTPTRCYRIGQAIREAVQSYPDDIRVGVLASGGLSHFAVDEELDRNVIDALKTKDSDYLCNIDRAKLNSGSSEIRNWICTAGAVEELDLRWCEYIPGYRTEAGTGTGLCFAEWH